MKRFLLDTHVILWWLTDDPRIGPTTRKALANSKNSAFVSSASIWEMSIKASLGKLTIPSDILQIIDEDGFESLPVSAFHALQAGQLAPIHKDPFDRMLIAQAQAEGLELITADSMIEKYGIKTLNPNN